MVSSSFGEFGTRRMTIRRPSVDPIPIEASDRIEVASENSRGVPPTSLNMYEPLRAIVVCGCCTFANPCGSFAVWRGWHCFKMAFIVTVHTLCPT